MEPTCARRFFFHSSVNKKRPKAHSEKYRGDEQMQNVGHVAMWQYGNVAMWQQDEDLAREKVGNSGPRRRTRIFGPLSPGPASSDVPFMPRATPLPWLRDLRLALLFKH